MGGGPWPRGRTTGVGVETGGVPCFGGGWDGSMGGCGETGNKVGARTKSLLERIGSGVPGVRASLSRITPGKEEQSHAMRKHETAWKSTAAPVPARQLSQSNPHLAKAKFKFRLEDQPLASVALGIWRPPWRDGDGRLGRFEDGFVEWQS
jgi:hypothetical protein